MEKSSAILCGVRNKNCMGNDKCVCFRTDHNSAVGCLLFRSVLMLFSLDELHRDTVCNPHYLFGIDDIHNDGYPSCQYLASFMHRLRLNMDEQCRKIYRFLTGCKHREYPYEWHRDIMCLCSHYHFLHHLFVCEEVKRID